MSQRDTVPWESQWAASYRSPGLAASGGFSGRSGAEPGDPGSPVYPDHLSAMTPCFFRGGLACVHAPLRYGGETRLLSVLWGASHVAVAPDAGREEKMVNGEVGTAVQRTAVRSDALDGPGAHARGSAASRSELRPRHACSVRTRTRHPGAAAAGCAGAAGRGGRGPRGGRGQRLIVRSVARRRWPPGPGLEVGAAAATASTAAASSSAAAALQPTRCLGSALLSQNGCRCRCRGRGSLGRLRAGGREEDHRAAGHRPQVGAEAPQLGHQRGQDGAGLPAEAGEAPALRAGQRRPRRWVAALPRSRRTGRRLCVPGARGRSLRDKPGLPAASRAAAGRAPRVSPGTSSRSAPRPAEGGAADPGRRWVPRPAVGAQRVHRSGSEAMVSLLTWSKLPFNCAQPFLHPCSEKSVVGVDGWMRRKVCLLPLGF